MQTILKGALVYQQGDFIKADIRIAENATIESIAAGSSSLHGGHVFDFTNMYIFPGFIDVHTHLREPGFFYKESILTGSLAAAHGGYTQIMAMPNLNPVPDDLETLKQELEIIRRDSKIEVIPYGAITKGQRGTALSDMEAMAPYVGAFSDDGRGVQNEDIMKLAMQKAKTLNKIIAAHCEDENLLHGGIIHQGRYAKAHNLAGISSASEYTQVQRDIALAKETGCAYHVCHVSTKESIALIRKAKQEGVNITCETAPHYLVFCEDDLQDDGRFKMNPPLRAREDKEALLEALTDGTIDMIATDHAPHSAQEKSKGLLSLNGVVGLECAFAALYTALVKSNVISLKRLIALMHDNPAERFHLGSALKTGQPANLCVFDLNKSYTINPQTFFSKGKSTPFEGMQVWAECKMTIANGRIAWIKK